MQSNFEMPMAEMPIEIPGNQPEELPGGQQPIEDPVLTPDENPSAPPMEEPVVRPLEIPARPWMDFFAPAMSSRIANGTTCCRDCGERQVNGPFPAPCEPWHYNYRP